MLAASVIIPTRDRPTKLAACLARLRDQSAAPESLEILVGLDGDDPESLAVADRFEEDATKNAPLSVTRCRRAGIAYVKNRLIERARGSILIFINDDVLPDHEFIARHIESHRNLAHPAMILGHSPWIASRDDAAFDQLLAHSSMIFFYNRMMAAADDRDRDWGFRHAWNLNLSIRREDVLAVGGFHDAIANCCYEDIELGWRLSRERDLPVLFRPEALAPHDHRYSPSSYLEREWRLGYSAWGFAQASPECARDVFQRDITSDLELRRSAELVERESAREDEARAALEALASTPAGAQPDNPWIARAYEKHLPLKRLIFNRGLLAASNGERVSDLFHAGVNRSSPAPSSSAHRAVR